MKSLWSLFLLNTSSAIILPLTPKQKSLNRLLVLMAGASQSLKKYEYQWCPQVHTGCIYTSLCYQMKWKTGSCMGQAQS